MGKETQPMNLTTQGLEQEQILVLEQAGRWLAEQGFYLAGGTALSIYLEHRRSVDLDWFTAATIPDPLILAQRLREAGLNFETGQTAPGTLHGRIGNVQASFIEFRYPLLQPLIICPAANALTGTALASLDDLACMKLSAIAQRGSRKDFYDMYALLARHQPLELLLGFYQKKFSVSDISPVLYGLSYFDDAEKEPEPILLEKVSWNQVKKDLSQRVKEFTRAKGAS
jgi:hypothetical protein